LRDWQHTGSFFKNPDPARLNLGVECGQMIPFGDGRWLWDFTHTYLVGRIENHRFVMQHADTLAPKANFTHWGGWERDDTGRVIFQTTKLLKLPVPELARLGWGRTHRLPLAATLTKDHRLVLEPVEEIRKLRGQPTALGSKQIAAGKPAAFALNSAHQEVLITFDAPASGQIGLRLNDGHGSFDIFFDAATQHLTFDPRKLSAEANQIPNDLRLFTQPLAARPGERITLRIFLDGALVEVFANQLNSAHWAWFADPDAVKAGVFTRGTSATLQEAQAWPLGTVWKELR
jgi:sucrose-6-phosphate hydrolase SacC (GH32 family)